jgi:hypothetical protein
VTTAFPGAIDAFTNPTASDPLDSVTVPHASQHANINDAVEAIETAIGTTAAPVLAPLASPTFTGTPAAPTAAAGTNTTQLATTAFVLANNFPVLGLTAGQYYSPLRVSAPNTTAVFQTTYYVPIAFFTTDTFDRISIITSAAYVGTGAVRLGIYNNDSATGKPSTVLLDAGTVATTAASTNYEITISQSLTAGYYWLAFNMQTAAATPTFPFVFTAQSTLYSVSTTGVTVNAGIWTQTGVSGAFATAGTLVASSSGGAVALRAS